MEHRKIECRTPVTSQLYTLFLVIVFVSVSVSVLGKGTQKCGKVWSLPNPPRTHLPLPVWSSFSRKKCMFLCIFQICVLVQFLTCVPRQAKQSLSNSDIPFTFVLLSAPRSILHLKNKQTLFGFCKNWIYVKTCMFSIKRLLQLQDSISILSLGSNLSDDMRKEDRKGGQRGPTMHFCRKRVKERTESDKN